MDIKKLTMTVTFNTDHDNPKNSQLIVALTGSREYIIEQLERMLKETTGAYNKPIQGQNWSHYGKCQIITPIWKGKEY